MSFTLAHRLPPLSKFKEGVGYTMHGRESAPLTLPDLGTFQLSFSIGSSGLPPSMMRACDLPHRRKWRAELSCNKFGGQGGMDRLKIVMAFVIKASNGRTAASLSPCVRWFQCKEKHANQRMLPPSASTGGRSLIIKTAWGGDGSLRADPLPGESYTLYCRLAPLEGVGRDGSIELFEDEEEMYQALLAWVVGGDAMPDSAASAASAAAARISPRRQPGGAAAASAASSSASASAAASPAMSTRARLSRSPAMAFARAGNEEEDDDGMGAGGGVGEGEPESFVVRLPMPPSAPSSSRHPFLSSSSAASARQHQQQQQQQQRELPLPDVPGGGKMPAPSSSSPAGGTSKRGGGGSGGGGGGGGKRLRTIQQTIPSPPSGTDTDGSLCSSCGGNSGGGGGSAGFVWKAGGLGPLPSLEQLCGYGYGGLRELQQLVGQAVDRLREDETLCPVCLEQKKDWACVPCGHRFCHDDIKKLIHGKCHVCSARVTQTLRLY